MQRLKALVARSGTNEVILDVSDSITTLAPADRDMMVLKRLWETCVYEGHAFPAHHQVYRNGYIVMGTTEIARAMPAIGPAAIPVPTPLPPSPAPCVYYSLSHSLPRSLSPVLSPPCPANHPCVRPCPSPGHHPCPLPGLLKSLPSGGGSHIRENFLSLSLPV